MGIDEDAIAFRKWQPVVESRLAALETRDVVPVAAAVSGPNPDVVALQAKVTELEAAVASMNATLANVEAALAPLHAAAGGTPGG